AYEGDGVFREYDGGYDDWLRQRSQRLEEASRAARSEKDKPQRKSGKLKKLSFNEQQELKQLPARIEQLETELAELQSQLADPDIYRQAGPEIAATKDRCERVQKELAQ